MLLLAVSGFAALDIYGHPSTGVLVLAIALAVLCLSLAVCAIRYLLVADDEGVWVRDLLQERHVPWTELRKVEVTQGRRGSMTLRIYRQDDTYVDVPAPLLLPSLPTKVAKARARIQVVAGQLEYFAAQRAS